MSQRDAGAIATFTPAFSLFLSNFTVCVLPRFPPTHTISLEIYPCPLLLEIYSRLLFLVIGPYLLFPEFHPCLSFLEIDPCLSFLEIDSWLLFSSFFLLPTTFYLPPSSFFLQTTKQQRHWLTHRSIPPNHPHPDPSPCGLQ